MSDDLLKLAERCEIASEADGVLDSEIEIAVNEFPQKQYDARNTHYSADKLMFVQQWFGIRYTASLDAAMTLVPEGMFVTLIQDPGGISYASIAPYPEEGRRPYATAPLAVTAAALRSRASA